MRLPAHTDIELPEPECVGHAPVPPQGGAETREEESDGEEVVEVTRQADGDGGDLLQPQWGSSISSLNNVASSQ